MDDLEHSSADEPKRSLDTLLLVGALVVAVGMLAYFFFGKDSAVIENAPPAVVEATPEEEQIQAVIASESVADELLTRARLAVESGMLVEPSSSNALYYYSLYLEQNPDDTDAATELQSVADSIGQQIAGAVADRDWARAAFLSEQVTNSGVASSAVDAYRADLEAYRAAQSDAALAAAEAGDESAATAALETLASLPRVDTTALLETRSAVRDALVAYRVQQQAAAEAAAAEQRARAQRQAEARARAAAAQPAATQTQPAPATAQARAPVDPLASVREAFDAGRITGPTGAIALLDGVGDSVEGRRELQSEIAAVLADQARGLAESGDPAAAERLRGQIAQLDTAEAERVKAAIDRAFIERAVAETVSAATLRRISAVAPVYPRTALRRNLTGRVKVEFTVAEDGTTRDIEVVESAAGGVFDRSAVRAVSEWRYEPREIRGQTVAQRVYAYLDYNLE